MLTLVPIETYLAKASCPGGPVVLSSLQEARTTRARAPAAKDRLRFITSPQGWNRRGGKAGNRRLIISVITQRRATPERGSHLRAHRAAEAVVAPIPVHSEARRFLRPHSYQRELP